MEDESDLSLPEVMYLLVDSNGHDRLLQANFNETAGLTHTEILRTTCKVYGSLFLGLFVVFLFARSGFPGTYNIKNTYKELNCRVALKSYGFFSWIWHIFTVQYEDIAEQCGMDAATTIRLLEFGAKLSFVGVINSFYLLPVYKYLGTTVTDDNAREFTLSNLMQGHVGSIATVISAYVLFGLAMRFIDKDFEWFTEHRHIFLSLKRAQNYSVFLSGLPEDIRTDGAIKRYFNNCFHLDNAVVDGDVALYIPYVEKKVAERDALLQKFEHSINYRVVLNEEPKHNTKLMNGEEVDSIPQYTKELEELNKQISEDIDKIFSHHKNADPDGDGVNEVYGEASGSDDDVSSNYNPIAMVSSFMNAEDGEGRDAAFITFSDLTSANLARQAVHHHEPWYCVAAEPPMPNLVNWKNVGLSNKRKKIGEVISLALTALLCVFWTIPVGIVASFSNVESLTKFLPFLKKPVENNPAFAELMAQIAPFILVIFISLLPYILLFFVKFEGLVEIESMQHPSLFSKLAFFTIIQTFFISTISGSLTAVIQEIGREPSKAVILIAQALPGQSAYFIQLILVQNLLSVAIELLRVVPVVQNWLRSIVANILGYNLTEKERNSTLLGLRSLNDPQEYYFGQEMGSKIILIFMVLFVYGCMSPLTCYFTLLVFIILAVSFRNQFIYIYPIANDSGGKLWTAFMRILLLCMIVAEIILFGVMLLKTCWIAGFMLLPLIAATILFDVYLKRRHYLVTQYLPTGACAAADRYYKNEGMTYEWLQDAYLQPALKERTKFPPNYGLIEPDFEGGSGKTEEETGVDESAEEEASPRGGRCTIQ